MSPIGGCCGHSISTYGRATTLDGLWPAGTERVVEAEIFPRRSLPSQNTH